MACSKFMVVTWLSRMLETSLRVSPKHQAALVVPNGSISDPARRRNRGRERAPASQKWRSSVPQSAHSKEAAKANRRVQPKETASLECREICPDYPENNKKSPQFCGFSLTNRTGESVLFNTVGEALPSFSLEAQLAVRFRRYSLGERYTITKRRCGESNLTSAKRLLWKLPRSPFLDSFRLAHKPGATAGWSESQISPPVAAALR